MKLFSAFILLLLLYVPAWAQEQPMQQLENYTPPPMFDSSAAPLTAAAPAKKKEPAKPKILIENPPLPPKRPKTLHASQSFIEKARKEELEGKKEEPVPAPAPKIERAVPTDLELETPTVQDVLDSIEEMPPAKPKKAKAPKPLPDSKNISLGYQPGVTEIPADMKNSLKAQAQTLQGGRVEVHAYATGASESDARRISLSRALEARKFLIESGIKSESITIRPLGDQSTTDPHDRVDILFIDSGK
jgi:hypothetical protein